MSSISLSAFSNNSVTFHNHITLSKPQDPSDTTISGQKTPDWMVEISGKLSQSSVVGYESYAELFDFYYLYRRSVSGHISSGSLSATAVDHSQVYLLIPSGVYSPNLRRALNQGTTIDTITIKRIGSLSNLKQSSQTLSYQNCFLTEITQSGDYLGIAFVFDTVREETMSTIGTAGKNVEQFNYKLMTN